MRGGPWFETPGSARLLTMRTALELLLDQRLEALAILAHRRDVIAHELPEGLDQARIGHVAYEALVQLEVDRQSQAPLPFGMHTPAELTRSTGPQQFRSEVPLNTPIKPGDTIVVKERWF